MYIVINGRTRNAANERRGLARPHHAPRVDEVSVNYARSLIFTTGAYSRRWKNNIISRMAFGVVVVHNHQFTAQKCIYDSLIVAYTAPKDNNDDGSSPSASDSHE